MQGLQVLLLAYNDNLGQLSTYNGSDHSHHKLIADENNHYLIESNLIFIGLVGISQDLREDTVTTYEQFQKANI